MRPGDNRRKRKPGSPTTLTRAVTLGAMRYRSVASILKSGLDRAPLPTPAAASQTELALPAAHENLRGAHYYH
ncbi:transposase [Azoarcus sp. CIB]|nr:transposase [Azoarcus sp. CIB]